MSVKSEVIKGRETEELKYPYLGRFSNNTSDYVVLFLSKFTGTVVAIERNSLDIVKLGEYGCRWVEKEFKPLSKNDQVIITQE